MQIENIAHYNNIHQKKLANYKKCPLTYALKIKQAAQLI